jgi:hypothetical protein
MAYARGDPAWRWDWNAEKSDGIGGALSVPGEGPDINTFSILHPSLKPMYPPVYSKK